MVVLPMSRPTLTLFSLLRTNNRSITPRLPWQTAVCGKDPQRQLSLFSSAHCAATLFSSSIRYKKCSKCVFAYTIIIIQSRAAFNPCCLFYTKKIVFFAQKAELFVNKCRFLPQKSRRTEFVQRLCTGGTFCMVSTCALAISGGHPLYDSTRKSAFGSFCFPYRFTKFSTRTSSSMCTG